MNQEDLKNYRKYLKSDKNMSAIRSSILRQITDYLNSRYPETKTEVVEDKFVINGPDNEEVSEELQQLFKV